jgi:hypothetical protein
LRTRVRRGAGRTLPRAARSDADQASKQTAALRLWDAPAAVARRSAQAARAADIADDWCALAAWTRIFGLVDLAAALIEVIDRPACWIPSGEGDLYGNDRVPVIGIWI